MTCDICKQKIYADEDFCETEEDKEVIYAHAQCYKELCAELDFVDDRLEEERRSL